MPGVQIVINEDGRDFACLACGDRQFKNLNGLLNHCENAAIHAGIWCRRCQRLFVAEKALRQHKGYSHDHWLCNECGVDSTTRACHNQQLWDEHSYCVPCESHVEPTERSIHDEEVHCICRLCDKGCGNSNDLQQHQKVHAPRDIACSACRAKFGSISATVLHQEQGTCNSGMTLSFIEQLARICDQERDYRTFGDDEHPYRCPGCRIAFRYMSGLLQHAESHACGTDVENGPLTKFCLLVASSPRWQ